MNENNIIKYKQSCLTILKADEDFLILNCTLNIPNSEFDTFLEDNLFADKVFLYKLEQLISNDTAVTKQAKERFFKEEIKRVIYAKSLEIQYQNQIAKLTASLDTHLNSIHNYNFFG